MKLPLFLAMTAMLLGAGVVHADDSPPRTISVTGSGSVQAAPDMANITIGVSTVAPTARAALDANNAQTSKMFARHINWNNLRSDLKEDLAHLVQDIKRRICGIAIAGSPSFSP